MTPPNRRHQRIVWSLENLLNDALDAHNSTLEAYHDVGVNIVSAVPYDLKPDVVVIRETENPDPRYAGRFYLVAEVLSESDKEIIDSKRDIYRAHLPAFAFFWFVRTARKSMWTSEGILAGIRRYCRVTTSFRCPRSASSAV